MKIWIIGRSFSPGKNETSAEWEQAKLLKRNGEDVVFLSCCISPTHKSVKWGSWSGSESGIRVYTFSKRFLPRKFPVYFNGTRNRIWSDFLGKVLKAEGKPDVINVHFPAMMMIAQPLKELHDMGIRIVATEHWSRVLTGKLDSFERTELEKYFDITDAFVCDGSPLSRSVAKMTGIDIKNICVMPNVVNSLFHPCEKEHDGFEFVCVGRLVGIKQFDKVIVAFAKEFKNEKVRLSILGDGEMRGALETLISTFRVGDKVTLLGSLDRERTAEVVSNSDCLICFSKCEAFNVPVAEAWGCGLPVIVTASAGVAADYFNKSLGVKVRPNNIDDLKRAMRYVYENKDRYSKQTISEFAWSNFSEKAVYQQLMRLFDPAKENND